MTPGLFPGLPRDAPKAEETDWRQRLPEAPRGSQKLPEAPRSSQRLPEAPRDSQRLPEALRPYEAL